MIKSRIARFAGLAAGAAMVVSFAGSVHADTISDLMAQIALLQAQLVALQGGSSASAVITSDLTVGSTGAQVSALQSSLVAKGYLVMPAGVPMGYFGSLTKAAVMRWQAAVGLPSTGFFGPLSRAAFNGSAGGSTTGGTVTGGGVTGTITTPGAEGTLSVTAAPVSNSTVYDSDVDDPILAFNAKSTGSDIAVQRVKIDLGATTNTYNDVTSDISLWDDQGHLLARSATNSNTVVKDSDNRYYLTLTGFSSVVPKGTTRVYTVKASIRDNADTDATNANAVVVRLAANGVRAIDGAGIDLYSPVNATDVTKTFTVSASLADSASLTVSANNANPLSQEVIAADGASDNELDKLPLLVFDIKADKDDITLTDLTASVTAVGGTGLTASSTYLYAGNGVSGSALASASLSGSSAAFNNMSYVIPKGTTKTFTLAADIRSANSTQTTVTGTVTGNTTNVVATNSSGDSVDTVSGTATGNSMYVRNVGPQFSLVGTPTITRTTASISTNSTSTATATFQLHVKAVGADVLLGTLSSTTPLATNGTNAPAKSFIIYQNGSSYGTTVYASSTDYSAPSGYTVTSNTFTVTEGAEVTIPVTFWFQAKLASTGADIPAASYAIALERINWVSDNGLSNSTFMAGKTEWRTPAVSLP